MEQALAERGVTNISPADGDTLYAILRHQPVEMGEISRLTQKDKSTVTGVVTDLEARGYVCRERSPEDLRRVLVSLTAAATKVAPKLCDVSKVYQRKLLRGFSKPEREQLSALLLRLQENLED